MSITLIFGEEDYCIWFKKHKIMSSIENLDFNMQEFEMFDKDTVAFCQTFPFMSDRRLCILQPKDLKDLDCKAFFDYIKAPCETTEVIILPQKVDKRSKVYKAIKADCTVEECVKLENEIKLKKMIAYFLKGTGVKIKEDASDELIRRLNYFKSPEVTLWTLKNTLHNLSQSADIIDTALVEELVEDNEKENVFLLVDCLKKGDLKTIRRQEKLILQAEGSTIGALSAMLREFRIAYKQKLFNASPKDLGVQFISLGKEDISYLYKGIDVLTSTITGIKNGTVSVNNALSLACIKLFP